MASKRPHAQVVQYRHPDPDGPEGWDVVGLACGHQTHLPHDVKVEDAHCGVCQLNHEAHQRELARIERQQARATAVKDVTLAEEGPKDHA